MAFAKGQLSGQATTNAAGAFSIPVPGAAASDYTGGLASLTPGGACVDALTKLPPPFTVGALVPAAAGEFLPRFATSYCIFCEQVGLCARHSP